MMAFANEGGDLRFEVDAAKPQVRRHAERPVAAENAMLKNTTTDEIIKTNRLELSVEEKTGDQIIRFTGFPNDIPPDGDYQLQIGDDRLQFFVLAGDINRDRKVDTMDFNILSGNFGVVAASHSNGDLNYDGTVDSKDLNIFQSQNGKSLPTPATQPSSQPS